MREKMPNVSHAKTTLLTNSRSPVALVRQFEVKTTGGSVEFQADAAMLTKMKAELQLALREEKDTHSQRFQRYMN